MIRVFIERTLLKDKEKEYHMTILQLRQKAGQMTGYLSGEILVDPENSLHCMVLSSWEDIVSWKKWTESNERVHAQKTIRKMLARDEKVSIFETANITI